MGQGQGLEQGAGAGAGGRGRTTGDAPKDMVKLSRPGLSSGYKESKPPLWFVALHHCL